MKFSQRKQRRIVSCGMLHRVVWCTDVKVTQENIPPSFQHRRWIWRQQVLLKCC